MSSDALWHIDSQCWFSRNCAVWVSYHYYLILSQTVHPKYPMPTLWPWELLAEHPTHPSNSTRVLGCSVQVWMKGSVLNLEKLFKICSLYCFCLCSKIAAESYISSIANFERWTLTHRFWMPIFPELCSLGFISLLFYIVSECTAKISYANTLTLSIICSTPWNTWIWLQGVWLVTRFKRCFKISPRSQCYQNISMFNVGYI